MLKCDLCEAVVLDGEAAMDAGWWPGYYRGEEEVQNPICPQCVDSKIVVDECGELVVMEDESDADARATD